METYDAVVIGAGQAGLSASYHLKRRGLSHVVLDADDSPGGAWQHRWDSLTMHDVHGIAALPDAESPTDAAGRANAVVPAYFGAYERTHDLPVVRPVRVDRVTDEDGLLVVHAVDRSWRTRTIVNATGTWTQPHLPYYPGIAAFRGEQLHTVSYPGPEPFRGKRVVVVGGGASAVQLLGEIAPVAADTLWVTRREPVWRTDEFNPDRGREAVALVEERVRRGLPPASVVSVTGLALREQEREAERLGAYDQHPMFERIEPDGVRLPDGELWPADVILWATGFRPAIAHLAPLHLRSEHGGIQLDRAGTTAVADPRVQLVGYGPSASTIGANRAGRSAARGVAQWLSRERDEIRSAARAG
ncbi:pyridine nucleotide-disulfide oxidoreductase [Nocardioides sp. Root1257]|uniref:FAD-dependent oxidoreductase n=1 Tax=unclassified Nocardioides TaxID=2615069 RepID=UPI0006FD2B3D|nr:MULTISPECIES: FAD-dependent oxidoreductase [unclassified Nocardioides]KQW45094.1 pyridine nucleotide-disulfide oxidoreductase [Nocardioides sp. Root1257]KRC45902.1 pyridine nucleotide-disulfide oxidoreductase [Nocardioides sp. Root224]